MIFIINLIKKRQPNGCLLQKEFVFIKNKKTKNKAYEIGGMFACSGNTAMTYVPGSSPSKYFRR